VRAPWVRHGVFGHFEDDGDTYYIIPNRDVVVLGGTGQVAPRLFALPPPLRLTRFAAAAAAALSLTDDDRFTPTKCKAARTPFCRASAHSSRPMRAVENKTTQKKRQPQNNTHTHAKQRPT
jgi:hypothetical protein